MITTDLTTLKINKLTKAQYEAALAAGTVSENELYMTPESEAGNDVFIATYGTTTNAEIEAAYHAGKIVLVNYMDFSYGMLVNRSNTYHKFLSVGDGGVSGFGGFVAFICNDNTWNVIQAQNLPSITSDDAGKTLTVNEDGFWVADIVQPDWNINDSTSSSYVKNRPFYTGDLVETYIVQDASLAYSGSSNSVKFYTFPSFFNLVEGATYKVYFNSIIYECVCSVLQGSVFCIGNRSMVQLGDDTGEPFLIYTDNSTQTGMYTTDTSENFVVSISTMAPEIVKIDKKYIPKLDNYLSKDNPTGTGSFSLNRKADTTVGYYSFTEGYNTTASGDSSHAEGHGTTASDDSSHAEGSDTTASGLASHAEGSYTTASGHFSHAEGFNTTASGDSSHAEGRYTTASSNYQHVQGKYNITDNSNTYVDIIGNGTSDAKRSNASTIDWSGNAWYAGDVYVGSTSGTNKDSGSKKLATEEYVSSLKPTVTTTTLTASNWDSTAKTYSFESTYPNASYDIEVDIDGDRCTDEQLNAWIAAKPLSSSTNKIVAKGDIPVVDIPIILTVTPK